MEKNNTGNAASLLFEVKQLPSEDWGLLWERMILAEAWRNRLRNYARLFTNGMLTKMGTSKLIAFVGLPGLGKTTLARGFANHVAHQIGGVAYGVEANAEEWRSQWLGEPAKRVKKAFAAITVLARQGPVILILDELESVAVSRKRTMGTAEPSDVMTAVTELLVQLDRLLLLKNVMVIATTNIDEAIDDAFFDRVDVRFDFDLPDCVTREKILRRDLLRLQAEGIPVQVDGFEELAEATDGLSGRQLGRLALRAMLEKEDGNFVLKDADFLHAVRMMKGESELQQVDCPIAVPASNGHHALTV